MKISDLLQESQSQLQEGPFTQAIGKVGGKIAKGVANVGKDLKTGFKAGYSGDQTTAAPAAGGVIDQVKKGFTQGSGEQPETPAPKAAAKPAAQSDDAETPAAEPEAKPETPAANPAAAASNDKAVAKLQADFEKHKEDTMTNLTTLINRIAKLERSVSGENPNIVQSNNSIERTGNAVVESIQLFKK